MTPCPKNNPVQKIRPARAPKGPGRPFSSERVREPWVCPKAVTPGAPATNGREKDYLRAFFFLVATFLAAFFFFFAMVMAPCHERPNSQHTSDPPGALREGSDDDGETIRDRPG